MDNQPTPVEEVPHRLLGVVPATPRNRLLWAWGMATFVLTMLPVWDVFANDARLVGGIVPLTVLWSYGIFAVINLLAIAVYVTVARDWVKRIEAHPDLVEPHVEMSREMSRRKKVLLDLSQHERRYAEGEAAQ